MIFYYRGPIINQVQGMEVVDWPKYLCAGGRPNSYQQKELLPPIGYKKDEIFQARKMSNFTYCGGYSMSAFMQVATR